ncbi:hypothetical protein SCHPADRAFT_160949 [Schizopora paradoxa]|uniref:Uncharacterized protein n=1 Tax=Schizopora paradoxa TaxID=27342 RepID=A0A0H2SKH1_9AGAM|nr:hypothetical protein SCHPADRAFT_160949 [Schizopora paradoxa]
MPLIESHSSWSPAVLSSTSTIALDENLWFLCLILLTLWFSRYISRTSEVCFFGYEMGNISWRIAFSRKVQETSATMKLVLLPALSFLFYRAYGTSGLSEACLGGSCSFEVEESPTSLGGIIELSGSSSAISDITPTAGWQILNCTDSTNSQAIRLVCEDESKGCAHLFQNGAQDTVIRLPDDCGNSPFVRVADHWVPDDQSIPSELASKLRRRDGTIPQVHVLQIDDDFNRTSSLQGPINFNFRAQGDHHVAAASVGTQRKRQGITTGNASETQTVNTNNSPTFILFKDILSCNTEDEVITGELEALLDVDTSFTIEVFVLVSGTVMPLEIFAFQFDAPTSASITGSFSQFATLEGTVSGEPLPLLSVDFNSLTIPGLATINPSFSITATPSGVVQDQPNFQSRINFNIQIDNLEFTYPANFTPATVEVSRPNLRECRLIITNIAKNNLWITLTNSR